MTRVLITGATGFVGGHLVRGALERGLQVRALVRASSPRLAALQDAGVELFVGDLTDPRSLRGCADDVDAVIHAACAVASTFDAGRNATEQFLAVNRDGTLNLAREILHHPGLRMVHLSSTAAMGTPPTSLVDETTPCNPKTPYQISKREAELALLRLQVESGLNVVLIRPCLVAGEGKAEGELLKLFRLVQRGRFPLLGGKLDLEKPIIAVDDLVEAAFLAAEKGRGGEIYLVHSDGHHTLGDFLRVAGRLTGASRTHLTVPLPLARAAAFGFKLANRVAKDWNPPLTAERIDLFVTDRRIDIGKARRELGYAPRHQDLQEMLGRTYLYYSRENLL